LHESRFHLGRPAFPNLSGCLLFHLSHRVEKIARWAAAAPARRTDKEVKEQGL
jgi:hypothetical protein